MDLLGLYLSRQKNGHTCHNKYPRFAAYVSYFCFLLLCEQACILDLFILCTCASILFEQLGNCCLTPPWSAQAIPSFLFLPVWLLCRVLFFVSWFHCSFRFQFVSILPLLSRRLPLFGFGREIDILYIILVIVFPLPCSFLKKILHGVLINELLICYKHEACSHEAQVLRFYTSLIIALNI